MKRLLPVLAAITFMISCVTDSPLSDLNQFAPNPELSPTEVVFIQLEALRNNDSRNRGIKIAFRFNSPRNRQYLSNVEEYAEVLKTESFYPMLDPEKIEYYVPGIKNGIYFQPVEVTARDGRVMVYLFYLSVQVEAPFRDCWMVDGVQSYQAVIENTPPEPVPPVQEIHSSDGIMSA